jgi:hypothetical protein
MPLTIDYSRQLASLLEQLQTLNRNLGAIADALESIRQSMPHARNCYCDRCG